LLRHHVAPDEGRVERHEQGDLRDEHVDRDGQRGNITLSQIAVAFEQRPQVALRARVTQEDAHQRLRDEEGAEADVSALLAEEFSEFVAKLETEHGRFFQSYTVRALQRYKVTTRQ